MWTCACLACDTAPLPTFASPDLLACLSAAVSAQKLAKEREAQLGATQYQLRVLQEDMTDMQVC